MIDSEKKRSDIDLVIVVRVAVKAVGPQRVAVERRDVGNHKGRQRAQRRVRSHSARVRNDVARVSGSYQTSAGDITSGAGIKNSIRNGLGIRWIDYRA